MKPYALIDLHCDTLTGCLEPGRYPDTMDDPEAHLSLSNLPEDTHWCQCFAIFLPDELTGNGAEAFYDFHRDSFFRQTAQFSDRVTACRTADEIEAAWASGKTAALLTVENGSALGGQLERVEVLARDGVKAITLTWNGINELGSGHVSEQGLTPFGRAVIPLMEENGILVDVSHLNDAGFYDVLDTAKRPFVATHSNARTVCSHKRNLTDHQIREMVARRCLIGLNYSQWFLHDGGGASPDDLRHHVERFLELGAQDCLALGSDFDGTVLPPWLGGPQAAAELYPLLQSWGLSANLCDKIFYRNSLDFFRRNLG